MQPLRKNTCLIFAVGFVWCLANCGCLRVAAQDGDPNDDIKSVRETVSTDALAGFLNSAIGEYSAAMDAKGRDARVAAFERAEQLFSQVVASVKESGGEPSASLLVNLGNSAIQAGNVGNAIVAYRLALKRDPSHAQATQNLAFARGALPDWARRESEAALVDTLFFWRNIYSNSQIYSLMGLLFLAAALLVAIGIAMKRPLLRNLAILPFVLWCILMTSIVLDRSQATSEGVINAEYSMLHSADSENSPLRLANPLPDGTEVEILQERDRWTEIRMSGKTGWVRSSTLARL